MNTFVTATGAVFGIIAIMLGAFGAHALKKILSTEKLNSFEVGVRYQMYSAITLLVLGYGANFIRDTQAWAALFIISGTLLFSGSIYFLSLAEYWKKNFKFLGPVTPLGGLLMILGWVFLLISAFN